MFGLDRLWNHKCTSRVVILPSSTITISIEVNQVSDLALYELVL